MKVIYCLNLEKKNLKSKNLKFLHFLSLLNFFFFLVLSFQLNLGQYTVESFSIKISLT